MQLSELKARWERVASSTAGRRVLKGLRVALVVGVVAYLGYELVRIGVRDVWQALPTHPLFYLLFLALYFSLPLAKMLVYRVTWRYDVWRSFPAFVKKRIYNKDVLGYSGEVYFYTWARRHVGLSDLEIAKTIRDQNIVSSVASTFVAVVLLAVFLYTGRLSIEEWIGRPGPLYLAGGSIALLVLVALAARFRTYLFSMALKPALLIFGIHCVRLVIGQGMQIGQWAIAMPEVPLRVWFTYAAVSILISRIPGVPNRDVLFLGAGVGLSGTVGISRAGVAGMLGAITAINKVLNLLFFALLSLVDRRSDEAPVSEAPAPGEASAEAFAPDENGDHSALAATGAGRAEEVAPEPSP